METLNIRHEIKAIYTDIYSAFDAVWHPALLSKLSAYGIQDQLHTRVADFLYSCSYATLNGILSSPLPVKAGVFAAMPFDADSSWLAQKMASFLRRR